MPPKKEKTTAKIKQKQKQSQKQIVNVNINNEVKPKKKARKKVLSSSQKVQNVAKNLRGNPTNDMVYRQSTFNRPVNHNVVPELPISGNQLMSEMRQIMETHIRPAERTPLQMTEVVKKSMMNKANGIVQNSIETQTEYPKEQVNAADKIKARIRQKISSDAVESIIEDEIDRVQQRPRTRATTRNRVRIQTRPNVTIEEYRAVFPDAIEPPVTSGGLLRKGTKKYNEYLVAKRRA